MSKFNGFDFYNNKQVVSTNGTPSNYVNAASTTKITSVYVPANTFAAGDILHIEWVVQLTGLTSGNSSLTLYWNETDDLTTPTQLLTRTTPNTTIRNSLNRRLSIDVANGTGNGSIMYGVAGASDSDFPTLTTAISSGLVLNWTADSYIILAGFCGTDTGVRTEFFKVSN
jgi:hypothetical protein